VVNVIELAIAAGLALVAIIGAFFKGQQAGRDRAAAKEAENRAKNLDHIRRAADARADPNVMSDPNNRDNRA
jgi:uncharacterized protein (UPF0333 family)